MKVPFSCKKVQFAVNDLCAKKSLNCMFLLCNRPNTGKATGKMWQDWMIVKLDKIYDIWL